VFPVGVRILFSSHEVHQQLAAAHHILNIEQFPT
jgi:hypothetical protein